MNKQSDLMEIDENFYQNVYAEVAKIPPGKVASYGKIAELAGYPGAYREVGIAMSQAASKEPLPYHRVVYKNGALAPDYSFGGPDRQKQLLLEEGITFRSNDLINMEKHSWPNDSDYEQLTLFD